MLTGCTFTLKMQLFVTDYKLATPQLFQCYLKDLSFGTGPFQQCPTMLPSQVKHVLNQLCQSCLSLEHNETTFSSNYVIEMKPRIYRNLLKRSTWR